MRQHRPVPGWFVFAVGLVLTATVFISAVYAGLFVLPFVAPVGCVCTAWAVVVVTRRFAALHVLLAISDTAIVGQWLWRRTSPMYDISETWYAMYALWFLTLGQIALFLYTHRE